MPKITVILPSIRSEFVGIVEKCLERQVFKDFEHFIIGPIPEANVEEPEKRKDDFYRLNGAWNAGLRKAQGEFIVFLVDGLWFPPDVLEKFIRLSQFYKDSCFGGVGHQYKKQVRGRLEQLVWKDPRVDFSKEGFFEIPPYDLELTCAFIPKKAIFEVGGFDEGYDRVAAWSEKELCCRIAHLGYKFYLDKSIEYRALYHPRLSSDWDEKYKESTEMFNRHLKEIREGRRIRVDYLWKL